MLKLGEKFDSFSSFSEKLEEYKKAVYCDFWIRDCRTLKNHAKKFPDGLAASADSNKLIYYYVRLACVKGGRKYISQKKIRKTYTFRQNCKAGMFLKISKCAKFLEIKELCEDHSHDVSEDLFRSLPQQRLKIPQHLRENCQAVLRARDNKKIVQNKIIEDAGCYVTLKDLTNLNRKPKTKKKFSECVDILKNVYSCDVQILLNNENLDCLFFQDVRMKKAFSLYPEMIFVDGTYSLHESRAATYIIMIEDSEGHGEVVAVAILLNEMMESIEWFIQTFRDLNPMTIKTNIIMSDKDIKERQVFKKLFPNAFLQICLFHTLQIFNREVSTKKMGITTAQAEFSKSMLQKLAYANSEKEYEKIYTQMKDHEQVPEVVIEYFEKNWEPIRSEWVLYSTFNNMCFLNKTNNKVENINQQLKSVISRYSSLEDFMKHFFIVLNSLRVNRNIKYSTQFHKISTEAYNDDSPQCSYQKYLTNYAFQHVQRQFTLISSVKSINQINPDLGLVETSEGLIQVTALSCECLFRTSMFLPCRHILRFREICGLPIFEKDLCLERWSRHYFFSSCEKTNLENHSVEHKINIQSNGSQNKAKKVLTNHQKFKMMNDECLKLSQICSEVSSDVFYQRIDSIKRLCQEWSENNTTSSVTIGANDNHCNTIDSISENSPNLRTKLDFRVSESLHYLPCPNNSPTSLKISDATSSSVNDTINDFVNENDQIMDSSSKNISINLETGICAPTRSSSDITSSNHTDTVNDVSSEKCYASNIIDTEHNYCAQFSLSDVKIPSLKVRGRPKGFGNTVIGLKRKRK